jgi:hypothetical protein
VDLSNQEINCKQLYFYQCLGNELNITECDLKRICCKKYKIVILPVVLYGCETWSLILREEHRLRVFENRVLRRIFGPKRDEVPGGWRKQYTLCQVFV